MRLLGLENRSTYQSWKGGVVATLPKDALERISYVMGTYKGLHILLSNCRQERHLYYVWDGRVIGAIYEKRALSPL